MASAIPTPLYPLYQDRIGFSGIVLSWIFSLYVCGTLAVLLLVGNLSDNIGRRPVFDGLHSTEGWHDLQRMRHKSREL
jgi:MFS family permease